MARNLKRGPWYVYIDRTEDMGKPFYVGKGNDRRIRDFKRNDEWDEIVDVHGVIRDVIVGSHDHEFILQEEIRLIKELATHKRHGGANLTDGGEGTLGWVPSKETRQRMRAKKVGKPQSAMHVAKRSVAIKKFYASSQGQAVKNVVGAKAKKVWDNSQYREENSAKRRGENNGMAVITEDDVRLIRDEWSRTDVSRRGATKAFMVKFATKHGVTNENIYGIVTRRSWKHIA